MLTDVIKLRQNIAEKGTLTYFTDAWKCFLCHSERSEESVKHVLRVCVMSVFFVAAAPRELYSLSPRTRQRKPLLSMYVENAFLLNLLTVIALVNRDRELIAYNAGKHGEADLSTQLYELLANDNNYNKPIFLSEEETKSCYGKEYDKAFTDEAIKYLVIKYKLKGGQLIHNHPEKRSPLTAVDIQSCLYFQLGKVTASCIDGSKYILVDDIDIRLPKQKIDTLIKQLKFVEAVYRILGTTWSFYDSFRFVLSRYNYKFRYYRKQEDEDRTDES